MKKRLAAAFMALSMTLSGCEWTQISVDSLLTPPTLMKEQKQIDEALKKEIGSGKTVNLVYPKSGSLRSAYLFTNLDAEPDDEALVFYRLTDNNGVTGSLKITLLDRVNQDWKAVWTSKELPANEVDKVSEVDEGDEHLLVLGITLFSSDSGNNQQMLAYRYRDQALEEIVAQECAAHAVCDLDGDGTAELMTIVKKVVGENEEAVTTATRYNWNSGSFVPLEQAALDPQVTSYVLTEGKTADGMRALYVDGTRGKEQITELLMLQRGMLINPLAKENTVRPVGLGAMDFDGDGAIELPLGTAANGSDEVYRVGWYSVVQDGLKLKQDTYTDLASGYYLRLPEQFDQKAAFHRSPDGSTVTFYEKNGDQEDTLFVVRVFAYNALTDGQLPPGYSELKRDGQLLYAVQMGTAGNALEWTEQDLRAAFALL